MTVHLTSSVRMGETARRTGADSFGRVWGYREPACQRRVAAARRTRRQSAGVDHGHRDPQQRTLPRRSGRGAGVGVDGGRRRPHDSREPERLHAGRGDLLRPVLVTLSTLMLEIALTRIFSVTMWYHFAFVAISVALFGLTFGALIVHLLPAGSPTCWSSQRLWLAALLFALSIPICFIIQLAIPFTPHLTVGGIASVIGTCVVISVPFVSVGSSCACALTRFPGRVNRLYAVDLIGAALGCVLLVVLSPGSTARAS